MDVVFAEDIAKGKEIDDEEKGPQDRALGHTSGDGGRVGTEGLELNELNFRLLGKKGEFANQVAENNSGFIKKYFQPHFALQHSALSTAIFCRKF